MSTTKPNHFVPTKATVYIVRTMALKQSGLTMVPKSSVPTAAPRNVESTAALVLRPLVTFRIIVIAWRRLASLARLMESLAAAHYHGFTVHLEFCLDGGAHPKVLQYVQEYSWKHGEKIIKAREERLGLERIFLDCWPDPPDNEYAFFFEDDLVASPLYFEYAVSSLYSHVLPEGKPAPSNIWTERFVGLSLYTPRISEISPPVKNWLPRQVIGTEAMQYLHQVPSSWGALYFPHQWRKFLHFYRFRALTRANQELIRVDTIPNTTLQGWRRSWKKYLVEWMFMRGSFMLYPSAANERCFSRHFREPGEHTGEGGKAQEHLLDQMEPTQVKYFGTPLFTEEDRELFLQLVETKKTIGELPILSSFNDRVESVYELARMGTVSVEVVTRAGWDDSAFHSSPRCALDDLTPPAAAEDGEKFLLFEMTNGLGASMRALPNAIAYARLLNRTLVIPPVLLDDGQTIDLASVIELDVQDTSYIRMISLDQFKKLHPGRSAYRTVHFTQWSHRKYEKTTRKSLGDELAAKYGLGAPKHHAAVFSFPSTRDGVVRNYGACGDALLMFVRDVGTFKEFQDPAEEALFQKWILRALAFVPSIQEIIQSIHQKWDGPIAGVVYSRGDQPDLCSSALKQYRRPPSHLVALVKLNCEIDGEATVKALLSHAERTTIRPKTVYVMVETALKIGELTDSHPGRTESIVIRTIADIVQHVQCGLPNLSSKIQENIASMLGERICMDAALFLGNVYSTASNQIAEQRTTLGLPTRTLGQ